MAEMRRLLKNPVTSHHVTGIFRAVAVGDVTREIPEFTRGGEQENRLHDLCGRNSGAFVLFTYKL